MRDNGAKNSERYKAANNKHTDSFCSTVFCTRGTLSRKSGWYHILMPTTFLFIALFGDRSRFRLCFNRLPLRWHCAPRPRRGTNGGKKAASKAKRYPLCENRRIPFTRNPPVSCCWGAAPIPTEHKICVLERWIRPRGLRILRLAASGKAQSLRRSSSPHKATTLWEPLPSAARFCKSLMGGQLSAAPPLFPVVHSLPPAPCPAPEYGRYWPWPSAALSFPRGLFGSRRRPLSSPPAARRTRYSAP